MGEWVRPDARAVPLPSEKRLLLIRLKNLLGRIIHIDPFGEQTCLTLYWIASAPVLLSLCLLIGPFQGADEQSHFYRAVQISEGHVTPVVAAIAQPTPSRPSRQRGAERLVVASPSRAAAGDYLDTNIHRLGGYYLWLSRNRGFDSFGESWADRLEAKQMKLSGRKEFVSFNNTVIYSPIAHIVPATTILIAKYFNKSPLTWLYVCRLVDSLLVIVLFSIAIKFSRDARWLVTLVAMLPRTLIQASTLSADTFLIPFAVLFAGLLADLAASGGLTRTKHVFLFVAMLFICVGKIAYIPLVVLPPLIAIIHDRRMSKAAVFLCFTSALTVVSWLGWTGIIKNAIFPIRHDVYINPYEQLHWVLINPIKALAVLARSIAQQSLFYIENMVGGYLGFSKATRQPLILTSIGCVLLAATACLGPRRMRAQPITLGVTGFITVGCVVAIFLLLYMQNTAVSAPVVDGVQGRYFLPLLPIFFVFTPKFKLERPWAIAGLMLLCTWASTASVDAVWLVYNRYDVFKPAPDLRLSNPHIMQVD